MGRAPRFLFAWIAFILSAAMPPLMLFTGGYLVYLIVSTIREAQSMRTQRDAFIDHQRAYVAGRLWKIGGTK